MKEKKSPNFRIIVFTIIALVLLTVLFVVLDWQKVKQLEGKWDLRLILLVELFTAASYACLSYGFVIVGNIFGIHAGRRRLFEVGLVSTAMNNILAFFGAAGHSLRLLLLERRGTTKANILAASIFHSYLSNIMMFILLPVGLFYLIISHKISGGSAIGVGLVVVLLALFLVIATAILFRDSLRGRILHIIKRLWHFIIRRDITPFINDLDNSLTLGLSSLRKHRAMFAITLCLMIANWVFTVFALWACFHALGNDVNPGLVLAGFGIGVSMGNISMIPGGLGVQEASMVGIYVLMGIPLELAVLASILFRVLFDFIPFFISLGFYWRLIQGLKQKTTE